MASFLDDSRWISAASLHVDTSVLPNNTKTVILDPLGNEHYQLLVGDLLSVETVEQFDVFRLGVRWLVNADIVGQIRSCHSREKFSLIEVDDGTGCVCCTVWHSEPIQHRLSHTVDPECRRVCEQLLHLAEPESNCSPQVGQMIHLRGRVKRFRGELRVSVGFSRVITDPVELLEQIVHRHRLMSTIYSSPYQPEEVARKLIESYAINNAHSSVSEARRILSEDSLNTFTKLDICLNDRLSDLLFSENQLVAFDNFETEYLDPASKRETRAQSKDLQFMADKLIERLLQEGWIYPASQPLGSHKAFRIISGDRNILEEICTAIRTEASEDGTTSSQLLSVLRRNRVDDWSRLTQASLNRLLETLESESRIYRTDSCSYKIA